ncbi:MAG TPA: TolC family protein [Oligoflexus sp.]|uniref:TolC family protein n=1 Tax=Oligoflexus sp. TaxID=1971216 RepID=UPI002D2AB0D2|nr:TolC family protein [Oligoflexus sp.]HYX36483.1 TolC family protein [Oligoflexus sp.]
MKRSLKITLVGLAWAVSWPAFAAFTLDQTFDLALSQSENLTLGRLEIERQQQSGEAIRTLNQPRARIAGDFSRVYSKVGGSDVRGDWQPSLHTELRQPIYEGGSIQARLQSVEYLTTAARWDFEAQKEELYLQVAQLFYQIVGSDSDIANLRETERIYRQRVSTLQKRASIGRSRDAEVLAARTQLEATNAQIQASIASRDSAQRRLAWLTGQSGSLNLSDRLSITDMKLTGKQEKILPTVEAARIRVALAESRIEEARTATKPRVDLIAAHDWSYPFPDNEQVNRLSFGVGLTWTLYDAGEVEANVKTAVIERSQANVTQSLETRENRLIREQAEQAYRDGLEQIQLYDKALAAAERSVKIQQEEFENGLLTNLEIMQALDQRLQIKRNRDQALYNAKLAYIEAQLQVRGLPKAGRR